MVDHRDDLVAEVTQVLALLIVEIVRVIRKTGGAALKGDTINPMIVRIKRLELRKTMFITILTVLSKKLNLQKVAVSMRQRLKLKQKKNRTGREILELTTDEPRETLELNNTLGTLRLMAGNMEAGEAATAEEVGPHPVEPVVMSVSPREVQGAQLVQHPREVVQAEVNHDPILEEAVGDMETESCHEDLKVMLATRTCQVLLEMLRNSTPSATSRRMRDVQAIQAYTTRGTVAMRRSLPMARDTPNINRSTRHLLMISKTLAWTSRTQHQGTNIDSSTKPRSRAAHTTNLPHRVSAVEEGTSQAQRKVRGIIRMKCRCGECRQETQRSQRLRSDCDYNIENQLLNSFTILLHYFILSIFQFNKHY